MCGVNLVFLRPTQYGILRDICRPSLPSSSRTTTTAVAPSSNIITRNKKSTCREGGSTGRKVHARGRGRGKCSATSTPTSRKRPQTLSEHRSQNYGIIAPIPMSLRGLKPINYVTLNDGLESDPTETPKRKKQSSHRPKSAPSATRVAAQANHCFSRSKGACKQTGHKRKQKHFQAYPLKLFRQQTLYQT